MEAPAPRGWDGRRCTQNQEGSPCWADRHGLPFPTPMVGLRHVGDQDLKQGTILTDNGEERWRIAVAFAVDCHPR